MAYSFEMARGQAGQLADARANPVITLAADEALDFGAPVMRGTGSNQAVISDATAFAGVALFEHNHENVDNTDGAGYVETDAVSVLTQGAVLVTAAVEVEAGEAAYVTATGTYTNDDTNNLLIGSLNLMLALANLPY